MVRFLKWIKSQMPFIWLWIETLNGFIVAILFGNKISKAADDVLRQYSGIYEITYRRLNESYIKPLSQMLLSQSDDYLTYFHPHGFDTDTLFRILDNSSYLMMGAFQEEQIVGYHFIRFFANGKCFRGNLVAPDYQGRHIGSTMIKQMTEIGLSAGFRVFATVSKHNLSSLASSKRFSYIRILEELPNDDILIEHIKTIS